MQHEQYALLVLGSQRLVTTMKKATATMKNMKSASKEGKGGDSPSRLINARIKELSGWRGETLARVRNDCGLYWLQFHLTVRCANDGASICH